MPDITYYGHSSFLVSVKGVNILFDPFISGNPATEGIVDIDQIKPDFILVTHGHQDHILDVDMIAKQSGATVIATYEVAKYFADRGLNTIGMNIGGILSLKDGVRVKMVNAVHTSSFPDGSYAGQASGFVVVWDTHGFYYSGDTALHQDMKLIAQCEHVHIDFAFLCMGDHYTMGVNDAVRAAHFVGTDDAIAMHFDTFDPIRIDHDLAVKTFDSEGLTLKIPHIGETFSM